MRIKVIVSSFFIMVVFIFLAYIEDQKPQESVVVNTEAAEKIMYLTFDDGPSKQTKEILDILDGYHIKATFFVSGNQEAYFDMIKVIDEKGHAIGVHTFSHDYKEIYSSEEAFFADIDKMNALIQKQTGKTTNLLRFPGGTSNTVSKSFQKGIMSNLSKKVIEKGYQYYDWNASNGDGNCFLNAETLKRMAISESKGLDVVMMLMHDGSCNKATVAALPDLIETFQSQGYVFQVINTETPVFHHHIAN